MDHVTLIITDNRNISPVCVQWGENHLRWFGALMYQDIMLLWGLLQLTLILIVVNGLVAMIGPELVIESREWHEVVDTVGNDDLRLIKVFFQTLVSLKLGYGLWNDLERYLLPLSVWLAAIGWWGSHSGPLDATAHWVLTHDGLKIRLVAHCLHDWRGARFVC